MVDIEELKRLAQPAEAEGVDVVAEAYRHRSRDSMQVAVVNIRQIGSLRDGDKLVRQSDHLAALSAVTAESDQLRAELDELALKFTASDYSYDQSTDQLRAEVEALRKDAERYQWLIKGTCDLKGRYWFPSLRSHDHQNPTEAIDAAMAAKG